MPPVPEDHWAWLKPSNKTKLPSFCNTNVSGSKNESLILAVHKSVSSLLYKTNFPFCLKYKKSTLFVIVRVDQIGLVLHKISRLPFSWRISLNIPLLDWRYFPFFRTPMWVHVSPWQFPKQMQAVTFSIATLIKFRYTFQKRHETGKNTAVLRRFRSIAWKCQWQNQKQPPELFY